jgi:hypothetical protein
MLSIGMRPVAIPNAPERNQWVYLTGGGKLSDSVNKRCRKRAALRRSSPVEEEPVQSGLHFGRERRCNLFRIVALVDPRSDLGLFRERVTVELVAAADHDVL